MRTVHVVKLVEVVVGARSVFPVSTLCTFRPFSLALGTFLYTLNCWAEILYSNGPNYIDWTDWKSHSVAGFPQIKLFFCSLFLLPLLLRAFFFISKELGVFFSFPHRKIRTRSLGGLVSVLASGCHRITTTRREERERKEDPSPSMVLQDRRKEGSKSPFRMLYLVVPNFWRSSSVDDDSVKDWKRRPTTRQRVATVQRGRRGWRNKNDGRRILVGFRGIDFDDRTSKFMTIGKLFTFPVAARRFGGWRELNFHRMWRTCGDKGS